MALSGLNTPPTVYGPILAPMTEDTLVARLSGNLNTVDTDLMDIPRATGIPVDLPPGISWDPQFHQFIIDSFHPAFQTLRAGEVTQITVNFFITDGVNLVPQSLIVTMTGANDVAVVSGTVVGAVTEDAGGPATGTLTVVDVDSGEAAFVAGTLAGAYGSLTIDGAGVWSYALDNTLSAVQALGTGQSVVETITVQTIDGTAQQIAITVTGADETMITGTAAADVLNGAAIGEMMLGLGGNDRLSGNGGSDSLDGGAGADSLYGGDGDDVLVFDSNDRVQSGGAGIDTLSVTRAITVNLGAADQISGDRGVATGFENVDATYATAAVTLTGSAGANILAGGAAGDRLTGGLGADVLIGNGGADRFIFRTSAETTGDEIADFTHGQDRIDLSAIDAISGGRDNGFAFIGGAAFTKSGQLRYDAATGQVQADVNGDHVADLVIDIGAGLTITATDFLL